VLHLPAIWNHLLIEDACGFQWRDVDAVTLEFPQNLHNTSPEYFRRHGDPQTCPNFRLLQMAIPKQNATYTARQIWTKDLHLAPPIISETNRARKLKFKNTIVVVQYSLRIQKFFCYMASRGAGPSDKNLGPH